MEETFKSKIIQKFVVFVLAALLIFLYLYKLDLTPVHLNQDEMMFGLNAYSIAKLGKDFYGNPYPFYFWHLGGFWATPIIVYTTSLILKIMPFSEAVIRISSALVGLISILLMALVAKKIFKDSLYAIASLIVGGTVPVLFINSRLLLDNVWPIPFVLFWLLLLKLFDTKKKGGLLLLFLSGLSLGIGLHSYHAAKLMMPIYFIATVGYLSAIKRAKAVNLLLLSLGFLIPIVLFIPWLKIHPDTLLNQVSYIGGIDKSINISNGIWGVFNPSRLTSFISNYLTYFSPKILFIEGDRSLIHSTGRVGAFSYGVALLLIFGILEIISKKKEWISKIILFGFLTYPAAPSIVNDPQRISRGLVVIPFVVLLSLYGIKFLSTRKEKAFRFLLIGIILAIIGEFSIFLTDYFGNYRLRSSTWFNGSIGNLYELTIKESKDLNVSKVYIDNNIYFAENYFDFYQIKSNQDLKARTIYFNPDFENTTISSNSIIAIKSVEDSSFVSDPSFVKLQEVKELNGYTSFLLYYKK